MGQKISDNLKTLGLTENEAEIYLALVKHSPCFVAPLVQETKKHRQMVYNALDTLLERNLITRSVQQGKYLYELSDPERLMAMVKEQELVAREVIERIRDQAAASEEQVEVFRGLDALNMAIRDLAALAQKNGEYLIINSIPKEYQAMTASFKNVFLGQLGEVREKGGSLKVLLFPGMKEEALLAGLREQYLGEPFETRVVTAHPEPPQTIWISGINVYLRNRLKDPLLIRVTSKDLSERYRKYFYELWEKAGQLA